MNSLRGKRLVVFGCGYIGGEVARQAVSRGAQVESLTRNAEKAESLRAEGIRAVVADLSSDVWHREIAGGADYVLNSVSSGGGGREGYRRSYVDGMQSLLRWARKREGNGTLVYTSSTSVYPQDHGVLVDETAPTEGAGELPQVLLEAEKLLGLTSSPMNSPDKFERCFILRLAGIYGPARHHLIQQVQSGSVAGLGEHHLNLTHRDDIVTAIWAAFEARPSVKGGIFNVADDGAATKKEIVTWLADQLGLPSPDFTGAPAPGRRAVTPDRIIANSKLKDVLGWRPRYPTFREGYKKMLAPDSE